MNKPATLCLLAKMDGEDHPKKRHCPEVASEGTADVLERNPAEVMTTENATVSLQNDASTLGPCVSLSDRVADSSLDTVNEKMQTEESNITNEPKDVEDADVVIVSETEFMTAENRRARKRKLDASKDKGASNEGCSEGAKPQEEAPEIEKDGLMLVEKDVGITEFISDLTGFSGTIKQRYSDFIVNEISSEGQVVRLTDFSLPDTARSIESPPAVESELLTEEIVKKLKNLAEVKSVTDEVLVPVGSDKELRGRLHQAIKVNFPDLDSNTVDRNGDKYIQIRFLQRKDSRRQTVWKKSTGDYCKFVLYKENKDTLEAINIISKYLRISPGSFSFAGTKDRRAKTSQDVTVYRVEPSRLHSLNGCLRNITLGNFRFCKQALKLGDLLGNRFTILLRNTLGSDEEIDQGLASLREKGFINYYGMQRFGTTRVPTHHVGRALLRGQWSEAVDLILKPREGDRAEVSKARSIWWSSKDPEKAMKELRSHHCIERKLLEGLAKHAKNDLVSALSWIPYKMRLMYIHAYQSYLWNCVLSQRIRQFGIRPVIGDLAMREQIPEEKLENEQIEGKDKATRLPDPVEVTEENLSEFSITDVVLPLPGYDVQYPKNEVRSWFEEYLKEDGMENFSFRNRVRDYSLPGGYRKIVVRPEHVAWEIMCYDDYQVPLVLGDLETMKNEKPPPKLSEGKFKAVRLELTLPSSSYATMALREVLKSGTSAAYHTTLNVT